MNEPPLIRPGMIVGILGGGQLGRMLAMAAAELGLSCHIYCPDPKSPAFAVAAARTVAPYDDEAALAAFAARVDVVTYEFENVPARDRRVPRRARARPPRRRARSPSRRIASPRRQLMAELGIAVAAFAEVERQADIYSALAKTGRPAILKTRRLGYDGKGQAADPRRRRSGRRPGGRSARRRSILEAFVPFEREISVILARGRDGAMRAFDVAENVHEGGILAHIDRAGSDLRRPRRGGRRASPRGSPRRSTMSACSRSRCSWSPRPASAAAARQRDRAARPQFRPLDHRTPA